MPALLEEWSREILFSFLSVCMDADSDGRTIDSSKSIWLRKRPRKFKSVIDSISIAYRTLLRLRANTILFHPSDSLVRISRRWLKMVNGLQWEDPLRWEGWEDHSGLADKSSGGYGIWLNYHRLEWLDQSSTTKYGNWLVSRISWRGTNVIR